MLLEAVFVPFIRMLSISPLPLALARSLLLSPASSSLLTAEAEAAPGSAHMGYFSLNPSQQGVLQVFCHTASKQSPTYFTGAWMALPK